ncbi:mip-related peptides [Plakobranchus ocellatus]|uniref:Mip-related peptides n=1 Tax=Plakobranchus ocellatus TaxID=259542 RepID=A0AAV4D2R1_9GAST|nr:mip-related peptides [Plakobranchus ocellatus]
MSPNLVVWHDGRDTEHDFRRLSIFSVFVIFLTASDTQAATAELESGVDNFGFSKSIANSKSGQIVGKSQHARITTLAPRFVGKRLYSGVYDERDSPAYTIRLPIGEPYASTNEAIANYEKNDAYFMGERDIGLVDERSDEDATYNDVFSLDEDASIDFDKKGSSRSVDKQGVP